MTHAMFRWTLSALTLATLLPLPSTTLAQGETPTVLDYEIRLQTVLEHDDGQFLWFHPRVAPVPSETGDDPAVVMTLQKHLRVSDYYSGLSVMRTDDLGATWIGPEARPELDWVSRPDGTTIAVCDVTPGWHAPTGKVIAVGAQVRYGQGGEQLDNDQRDNQTAYAVHDPVAGTWTPWRTIEMPADAKFDYARSACAQWLTLPDGTLLLPFYYAPSASAPASVTVVRCSFDGNELKYLEHGNEMELPIVRGLCEPSIAWHGGKFFLTIRNDLKGYVTRSDDGLHYEEIRPWTFDDGAELGSYNTQQHWVSHSDGLFLVYTRSGANNDHIMRHRAPLFIAQVDPERLVVLRDTERVLIPERGATLGNFGAAAVSERESWVTVSEGVWGDDARRRGATGATFVARIIWNRPNALAAGIPEG